MTPGRGSVGSSAGRRRNRNQKRASLAKKPCVDHEVAAAVASLQRSRSKEAAGAGAKAAEREAIAKAEAEAEAALQATLAWAAKQEAAREAARKVGEAKAAAAKKKLLSGPKPVKSRHTTAFEMVKAERDAKLAARAAAKQAEEDAHLARVALAAARVQLAKESQKSMRDMARKAATGIGQEVLDNYYAWVRPVDADDDDDYYY